MNKETSDNPSVSRSKTSKNEKKSSENPSISETNTGKNEKETPAIRFIGELDELTRSDLNNLISDPKYNFLFKNLNFVNNLQREKEKK